MLKYIYFLSLVAICVSCVHKQERVFILETEYPEDMMCEITNSGNYSAEFSVVINDLDLSTNYKIVNFIKNMPKQYPEEPLEFKAARFVYDYSWRDENITKNKCIYNPKILVNSVGGGLCGVRSAIFTNILRMLNYTARSVCLEGHVVTEVFINDKWQVIDVDNGVYYNNSEGNIASIADLAQNPSLFEDINNYNSFNNLEINVMKSFLLNNKEMYSTIADNRQFYSSFKSSDNQNSVIYTLPSNSCFSFPYSNSELGAFYTLARLEIPAYWTGEIRMPFILERVEGKCECKVGGELLKIEDRLSFFNNLDLFDKDIEITKNDKGIVIYYFINPLVFKLHKTNKICVGGIGIDGLDAQIVKKRNVDVYFHPKFKDLSLQFLLEELKKVSEECQLDIYSNTDENLMNLEKVVYNYSIDYRENNSLEILNVFFYNHHIYLSETEKKSFAEFLLLSI
ncbi:MAG: transglutaminase domain-containing protein [Bacteroidales bacterium]|nr:transglutaminase domain-containing protein [Bacteroidales bacterium]